MIKMRQRKNKKKKKKEKKKKGNEAGRKRIKDDARKINSTP